MNLNQYATEVHRANAKWWVDISMECPHCLPPGCGEDHMGNTCRSCDGTGHPPIKRNVGELLMLCTSELSEAMEGHRKDLMDDKLPHRKMFEVELADCVIRILDICAGMGLDLEGAYREKMAFNAVRLDHQREHRMAEGGKKY